MTELIDLPETLPEELSLILVRGAILLPKAKLPIPVLDSAQMSMIFDALKKDRLVGLIQPSTIAPTRDKVDLFNSGTLAYIYDLTEIDEKLVALLYGVTRFDVISQDLPTPDDHGRAKVSYERYQADMVDFSDYNFDRDRLLKALRQYFSILDVTPDWSEIENTPNDRLISTLAMVCPFEAQERQAVLESPTIKQQSELVTSLIEMATFDLSTSFPHYLSQEVH